MTHSETHWRSGVPGAAGFPCCTLKSWRSWRTLGDTGERRSCQEEQEEQREKGQLLHKAELCCDVWTPAAGAHHGPRGASRSGGSILSLRALQASRRRQDEGRPHGFLLKTWVLVSGSRIPTLIPTGPMGPAGPGGPREPCRQQNKELRTWTWTCCLEAAFPSDHSHHFVSTSDTELDLLKASAWTL